MRPIDADALTKELKHITDAYGGDDGNAVFTFYCPLVRRNQLVNMEEFIKRCQTIDSVKHGTWEPVGSTTMGDPFGLLAWGKMYKCSECGFARNVIKDSKHYKFCPNCGAQLEIEL